MQRKRPDIKVELDAKPFDTTCEGPFDEAVRELADADDTDPFDVRTAIARVCGLLDLARYQAIQQSRDATAADGPQVGLIFTAWHRRKKGFAGIRAADEAAATMRAAIASFD